MDGVGARLGRSSARYAPTTVFTGPVRRWKKKWIQGTPPSSGNNHSRNTANGGVNGSNISHLLLFKWIPITASQNNNDSSSKDDVVSVEEPPKRKFKYIPGIGGEIDSMRKWSMVEELEKVEISEEGNHGERDSLKIVAVLRRFVGVQQRRAEAYARLKRGFEDYMASGVESTYQQLCSEITDEFNDCSKQVLEMESQFLTAHCFREDLSLLLRSVQNQEKMKLQLNPAVELIEGF